MMQPVPNGTATWLVAYYDLIARYSGVGEQFSDDD